MIDHLDVRHLPYMPLVIETLRKSKTWLRCRRRPELGFYLVNLWMRAWHEVPAGSIEDDDDILADAAMCAPEAWEGLRDTLLEGWERRDGRLYHRTVTDLATEAVTKMRGNRKRTEAARLAAEAARREAEDRRNADAGTVVASSVTDLATEAVTASVTRSKACEASVTGSVTDHEGKGREGNIKEEPTGSSKKRAFRLPDDWQPDHSFGEAEGFSTAEINREADKFRDHWRQQPGQKGVKLDWTAAWRNWIRKSADDRKARKGGSSRSAPRADDDLTNDFLFGGRR